MDQDREELRRKLRYPNTEELQELNRLRGSKHSEGITSKDHIIFNDINGVDHSVLDMELGPCDCLVCLYKREHDRYWQALQDITAVVDKNPGTPGFPTIMAIIKKAATPELINLDS